MSEPSRNDVTSLDVDGYVTLGASGPGLAALCGGRAGRREGLPRGYPALCPGRYFQRQRGWDLCEEFAERGKMRRQEGRNHFSL